MSELISFEDAIKELGLRDFELIMLFPKGLKPLKKRGREEVHCPWDYHLGTIAFKALGLKAYQLRQAKASDSHNDKEIKNLEAYKEKLEDYVREINRNDPERHSWKYFDMPDTEEGLEELIIELDVKNVTFKKENFMEIKEAFGDKIVEEMDSNASADFEFRKTGPTWEIVYEGKKTSGLRQRGFSYIHYLVSHSGKDFDTNELAKAVDGIELEYTVIGSSTEIKNGDNLRDVADGKTRADLTKEWARLRRQVEEAENNNDLAQLSKTKEELEKFEKYYYEMFRPGGKSRKFMVNSKRNSNRINRSVARAIEELKRHNEKKAARHFKQALKPIYSHSKSYSPDRHIPWLLR
jgi:hypothetical protein